MRTLLCTIAVIGGYALTHNLWLAGIAAGLVWGLISWGMERMGGRDKIVMIYDPQTGQTTPQPNDRATRRYVNGRDKQ